METQLQTTEKRELSKLSNRLRVFTPRIDVYENDEEFKVSVEMPGVHGETVDVTVENGILTIAGKGASPAYEGYRLRYSEYKHGDFHRSLRLSEEVDPGRIVAEMDNGVLRLTLPKSERVKARKIKVKAG